MYFDALLMVSVNRNCEKFFLTDRGFLCSVSVCSFFRIQPFPEITKLYELEHARNCSLVNTCRISAFWYL